MHRIALALLVGLLQAPLLHAQMSGPRISRLVVDPGDLTVTSGDTLRLKATALDSSGRPVPGVTYHFESDGVYHRATVSPDGLVTSGNAGRFPILVTAHAPGQEPFEHRLEIRMQTGEAAYIEITPPVEKLVVGQSWSLTATTYSRLREIRREPVTWSSSAPEIVRVDERGQLAALAPGRATITVQGSGTEAHLPVDVVGSSIAEIVLTPGSIEGRPGQVIRFKATPRDAGGEAIEGLTPVFSVDPRGSAVISADGIFVGYAPGEYRVTASVGTHSVEAVVRLGEPPR